MRIVFVGDVFGRSGRDGLLRHLPEIKARLNPDVVIVNGENSANGSGITAKICEEFYATGVDVITTGNHIWAQREILTYIDKDKNLLRPINYADKSPGNGHVVKRLADGRTIMIANAMGRVDMKIPLDDPFSGMDRLLQGNRLGQNLNAIFVDFHAEATSEKMAMGHYLDGRVSCVVGTHTHVPTADAQILPGGTAYQTDAGMVGDFDSVIGSQKDQPIFRFLRGMSLERFQPATGEATLCGVYVTTNDRTGLATSIAPIRMGGRLSPYLPERKESE
ncbi:MAG: TIGR00282 family metallophosphoesterase [Pseudomonadota bacterium]